MSWSEYIPSIVAFLGIPLAAALTWGRESAVKMRQERREDAIRREQHEREERRERERYYEWVSQRWWERKAEAYAAIVEALWHVLENARETLAEVHGELDSKRNKQSTDPHNFVENHRNLKKVADIGLFVISNDAAEALQKYVNSINAIPDYAELDDMVTTYLQAAKLCLNEVREAAIKDLGIDRPRFL